MHRVVMRSTQPAGIPGREERAFAAPGTLHHLAYFYEASLPALLIQALPCASSQFAPTSMLALALSR